MTSRSYHNYIISGLLAVIATIREHVSRYAAIPSKCWQHHVLHFGQVSREGRVAFNRAHLVANEDYYECRIYTLC